MCDTNDKVFLNWSETAAFWDKHCDIRRTMYRPVTLASCREAGVPESTVDRPYTLLDVAGGTGDVSMDVAQRLGPNATIWCTDLIPDMVKTAERTAADQGLTNVRGRECGGEDLPFDSSLFDAVLCRFGIMFFRDPLKGVQEALRVLKPGCRFGYCVWGARELNPFHHIVQDVLDRYVPGPPADPDAPGAYRFAPPGKLAAIAKEAGATDVCETVFRFNIEAPVSFDHYFELRTEMSDSLRDKLRRMSPDRRAQFKEEVRSAGRPYFAEAGFSIPAEVLIVSASKR